MDRLCKKCGRGITYDPWGLYGRFACYYCESKKWTRVFYAMLLICFISVVLRVTDPKNKPALVLLKAKMKEMETYQPFNLQFQTTDVPLVRPTTQPTSLDIYSRRTDTSADETAKTQNDGSGIFQDLQKQNNYNFGSTNLIKIGP